MNEKLRDAVIGFAVGDALGVPFEFRKRDSFKCTDMVGGGTWNQPMGTWSDDTSLVLATCKSIKDNDGCLNYKDIMSNFVDWFRKNAFCPDGDGVFDVGNTTHDAICRYDGSDPFCGSYDLKSNGNGSLMRILPVAFINHNIMSVLNLSRLTHAHQISLQACQILVSIIDMLLDTKDINIDWLFLPPTGFERLKILDKLSRNEIKSSGFVVDTLEAALWCVLNTDNYKDCVLTAVNLGDDTDTVAAIAGGLAGIIYGLEGIPQKWIDSLRDKDLIYSCLF